MTSEELRLLIAAQLMPSRMETFNQDCGDTYVAAAAARESLRLADILMSEDVRRRLKLQEMADGRETRQQRGLVQGEGQ